MKSGNRKLLESFLALFSMDVFGYAIGFITFPYLTHILGAEKFGLIAFAASVCGYFRLITTYSFSQTAPRDVALAKDHQVLKKVFSSIFWTKLCLLGIVSLLYFPLILSVPFFNQNVDVYMALYLGLLGDALFPVWFFQGIERMRFITGCNLAARLITSIAIFSFVNGPNDVAMAALLQSTTELLAGVMALVILFRSYSFVFAKPDVAAILHQLKGGWIYFWSGLAANLYLGTDTVLLGIMTNNTVVGYYTSALKLVEVGKKIINTSATAIFPRASSLMKESVDEMQLFLGKWLKYLAVMGFFIGITGSLLSDFIVQIVLGDGFERAAMVFSVMIWIPGIIAFTQIHLNITMLIRGWASEFRRVVVGGAIVNFIIIFPLIHFYEEIGIAIAMLVTEMSVMVYACYIVNKKGVHYIPLSTLKFFSRF